MSLIDRIKRLEAEHGFRKTNPQDMTDRELTRLICGNPDRVLSDDELLEIIRDCHAKGGG